MTATKAAICDLCNRNEVLELDSISDKPADWTTFYRRSHNMHFCPPCTDRLVQYVLSQNPARADAKKLTGGADA